MLVTGDGRSADYVEVLRGIHFVHRRPEDINTRTFRLTCIELRDHYASNQLAVQVVNTNHRAKVKFGDIILGPVWTSGFSRYLQHC